MIWKDEIQISTWMPPKPDLKFEIIVNSGHNINRLQFRFLMNAISLFTIGFMDGWFANIANTYYS